MPANHHIDSKNKLIITSWEGEAVDVELIEAIKNYQKNIKNQIEYIDYNEVVDFTKITNIKITTEGIKNIAQIAAATDSEVAGKLAFVVSSNLAFGLVRMYQAYRTFVNNSNKVLRVFKNKKDALEWVIK